jgi:hypothetical protein
MTHQDQIREKVDATTAAANELRTLLRTFCEERDISPRRIPGKRFVDLSVTELLRYDRHVVLVRSDPEDPEEEKEAT